MVKNQAIIRLEEEQEQLKYRIRAIVKSIIKKQHEKENCEDDKRILREILNKPNISNATKIRYEHFAR